MCGRPFLDLPDWGNRISLVPVPRLQVRVIAPGDAVADANAVVEVEDTTAVPVDVAIAAEDPGLGAVRRGQE